MRSLDELFANLDQTMDNLNEARRLRRLARVFGKAMDEARHTAEISDLLAQEARLFSSLRRSIPAEVRQRELTMQQEFSEFRKAA